MKATYGLVYHAAFALAILCAGLLVYNMVAMPIYKEQVFLERGTITAGGEMVILIGFVLVPIFDIVSLLWVLSRIRQAQAVRQKRYGGLSSGHSLPDPAGGREGDGG
jgi:hypothetical protein